MLTAWANTLSMVSITTAGYSASMRLELKMTCLSILNESFVWKLLLQIRFVHTFSITSTITPCPLGLFPGNTMTVSYMTGLMVGSTVAYAAYSFTAPGSEARFPTFNIHTPANGTGYWMFTHNIEHTNTHTYRAKEIYKYYTTREILARESS